MPFQPGQRVGDYEILQMIGSGGMGHVYRVRNIISNRMEAMKVLLPDLTAEPELAVRFVAEIRTLASFDHPNIAQLHTALQAENQLIMMMEFVEGVDLERRAQQQDLSRDQVVQIVSQTLSALSYAHARGVVHRDIKPANIMVTTNGAAKLMDFGIAKSNVDRNLTVPGTTLGSVFYMSPEQVRGGTIDPRSDIYSIGIVLYELLAGAKPFSGDTSFGVLNAHLNVKPQPPIELNPSLPAELNAIILKALAKDPAQRFQSADEFRNALAPFATAAGFGASDANSYDPGLAYTPINPDASFSATSAARAQMDAPIPPEPAITAQRQPTYTPGHRGSKVLWISTGALAVVIALFAAGFALPRLMRTHAASSPPATSVSPEPNTALPPSPSPAANASAPAAAEDTTPATHPTPNNVQPEPPTHSRTEAAISNPYPRSIASPHPSQSASGQVAAPNVVQPQVAAASPSNSAELAKAQEELIQLDARAQAARRAIQQIRSQQEQAGLGMRGDIDSSESRLDAYLRSSANDLQSGDAALASRDMEKVEAELQKLEKFLGR